MANVIKNAFFILTFFGVVILNTGCVSARLDKRETVVYGKRSNHDLTYELMQPKRPNGIGIVFIVSGSWRSNPDDFKPVYGRSFLKRGYTLFAVSHLSQPDATIPQIYEDVTIAVKHIRTHAKDYGISPDRLGVSGASAGGHLALMLATKGKEITGNSNGLFRAVAVFFPVTDLLNLGKSSENANDGGPPKRYRKVFGIDPDDLNEWKRVGYELSPLYHVDANTPPVLIIHGDKDALVPIEQSERFLKEARNKGATVKLIRKKGKEHGWSTIILDMRTFAKWFDQKLKIEG
ncbi:MAG: alpha/beta hydrolase [Verrucomicrobiota bacterium]|nr:alpha/beta hydrolase [Verrucomicrobiota bacterium]